MFVHHNLKYYVRITKQMYANKIIGHTHTNKKEHTNKKVNTHIKKVNTQIKKVNTQIKKVNTQIKKVNTHKQKRTHK
jgi:glutaredoxin 2